MKTKNSKLGLLVAIAAIVVAGGMFSCKKSGSSLPKIGPYDNSNQVASANLLAHWTFDGTYNETISSTAPSTTVGASFTTGVKGQALNLASGYLLYPAIAKLNSANAVGSFTVSAWVKVDNNGSTVSSVFALTQSPAVQKDWNTGPITMYLETGHAVAYDDTLVLDGAFSSWPTDSTWLHGNNINDYGVRGTDFQTVHGAKQWVHYVLRYDGAGSNIDIYANGVRVSNNKFRFRSNGATPPVGYGPIVATVPTEVLIGALPNANSGFASSPAQVWQGLFTGLIDEVRVYNIALQDTDIGFLYQLELAAR
jgi:hypothetical protein